LHERKIIHRDIKTDNLLFSRDGVIKLGDFGTAKQLTQEAKKVKEIQGTINYMSPELLGETDYDVQTDIWSLGILCVELANMERPYMEHSTTPEDMQKVLKEKGAPKIVGDCWSSDFKDFVSLCLITNTLNPKQPRRATAQQLRMHKWLQGAQTIKNEFAADI